MHKIIDYIPVKKDQSALSDFGLASYAYSDLGDIRNVADKAMMILCPIEYFDMGNATKDAMFQADDKELVLKSINNFTEHFSDNANVYALCPPQFYDMTKHANSDVDKLIYAGQFQQAFFSIAMVLPMIRELQGQINNLDSRVSNLECAQAQVQEQLRQQSRNILLNDPMLFAIPKKLNIMNDTNAILGTCWGADINEKLLNDLNIQSNMRMETIINLSNLNPKKEAHIAEVEDLKRGLLKRDKAISDLEHSHARLHQFINSSREKWGAHAYQPYELPHGMTR